MESHLANATRSEERIPYPDDWMMKPFIFTTNQIDWWIWRLLFNDEKKSGTLADWIRFVLFHHFGCVSRFLGAHNRLGCNSPMSENSPLKIVKAQKSSSTGSKSPVLSSIH